MDLRKELIDFLEWYHSPISKTVNTTFKEDVENYLKSINCGSSETQAVRQNEQLQEHCKNPDGKESCGYKDKDLIACKLLRNCPFCDASS